MRPQLAGRCAGHCDRCWRACSVDAQNARDSVAAAIHARETALAKASRAERKSDIWRVRAVTAEQSVADLIAERDALREAAS